MSNKKQQLSKGEYDRLLRSLRTHLTEYTLERIAPLVWFTNWLLEDREKLKNELRRALQPELFPNHSPIHNRRYAKKKSP